jgi:hypothetical protein
VNRPAIALPLLGVLACATFHRGEGIDPSAVPAALRDDHELFSRRCSRCHPVSVPLLAHVSDVRHWARYVERMRRQPNSGITAHEAPALVRFLTWYTESQRPGAPAPQRSVTPAPPVPVVSPAPATAPGTSL